MVAKAPNALYALVAYSERKNVFIECPKLVVLWLVSCNNLGEEFYSLGPSTENARRPNKFRRYDGTRFIKIHDDNSRSFLVAIFRQE